tara:strand:- start:1898 stop:2131 length:234 start_codon:yes stop_codon:yes gene_type:complete
MLEFLEMKSIIKEIITTNIPDAECDFDGDSCNLRLIVSSSVFSEMPLIEQHKKVMKLLEDKFESGELHALSLETKVI